MQTQVTSGAAIMNQSADILQGTVRQSFVYNSTFLHLRGRPYEFFHMTRARNSCLSTRFVWLLAPAEKVILQNF